MDTTTLEKVIYRAIYRDAGALVFVHANGPNSEGVALNPRLDIRSHSPTGFSWGYNGSGPAQLGLGLMADYFRRVVADTKLADTAAQCFYQFYKEMILSQLPARQPWTKTALQVAQDLCAIATARPETFAFALRRLSRFIGEQRFAAYCETLEALAQEASDGELHEANVPPEPTDTEIHAETRAAAALCFPTMPLAMIEGFLREPAGA